jgi:hypothetical protein
MMGRSGGLMVMCFERPIGLIFMQEGCPMVRGSYTEMILSNTTQIGLLCRNLEAYRPIWSC